jgi:hydroxymethylpyrimidine pyrophosphatase-like HAD family hydrolase
MKVIETEKTIFYDMDDTLIMHTKHISPLEQKVTIDFYGENIDFAVHTDHVKLLKNYKARGFTIFGWSGNGYKHAENVIKALNLEDYVDFVLTKPYRVIDDSEPNNWAPRIYLPYSK